MSGLRNEDLIVNLFIVFILQMITRFLLVTFIPYKSNKITPYRFYFYLAIISWILAGFYAFILHSILYPQFPTGSYLKILSGYWLLGAGILSQLEYVIYEHQFKKFHPIEINKQEQISRRILEGFIVFTIIPVLTLIFVVERNVFEHKSDLHTLFEVLYIGLFCIFIAIIVAIFMGKLIKSDTKKIISKLQEIENGDYTQLLQINRVDELGEIAKGISFMNEGLIKRALIQEAFSKFVDPFISNKFIDENINHLQDSINFTAQNNEVAILMCDIRNFTQISEQLTPEQTVEMLNIFFNMSVKEIKNNHGILNKFIGDAIMVVFGLDEDNDKKEFNALQTAINMQNNMNDVNTILVSKNIPPIQIGIGLHTGNVASGYVGNEERLEFTVIGSTVNITSRIESQTKPLQKPILFSSEFNSKIDLQFKTSFIKSVELKGVSTPKELYTVD